MEAAVHDKLGKGEKRRPIILLIVAIEAKILFQFLVSALRLSVGLGMISRRWKGLDRELFPKGFSEFGNEGSASIRDDGGWQSEVGENFGYVMLNEVGGLVRSLARDEDFEFGEEIYND
jgi:hypothetical protein